jgi:hypothetical protein
MQWRNLRWGGWCLEGFDLVYRDESGVEYEYPMDLECVHTSAEMLDIIMHVAGSSWATDTCLAGLVRALDDLFHPQANLCPGGAHKTMSSKKIRQLFAAWRAKPGAQLVAGPTL